MLSGDTVRQETVVKRLCKGIFLCLALMPAWCLAMSVVFINPGKKDEIFWLTAARSMGAAAGDLGIQLEVIYAERNHLNALRFARQLAERPRHQRPDYLILSNDYGVGPEVLRLLEGTGIRTFFAYSGITDPRDRQKVQAPRKVYKNWIGVLEPNSEEAGYLTASAMIAKARAQGLAGSDHKLHMIAIAGDRSTTTSLKRNQGMLRAVTEQSDVVLEQQVYGEWNRAKAREQSDWLYQRYPQVRVVWAGNDLMAFGAMESWAERGGKPGSDAVFSGINTSEEAMTKLRTGSLAALAGGHFIAGAYALVMLYDYHNGHDFADEGLELERSMFILFSADDAKRFQSQYGDLDFHKVDFRRFSKVLNPAVRQYQFSFRQILSPGRGRT